MVIRTRGFDVTFPNIFTEYEMEEDDKKFEIWNNHPFKLWQTQLKFAVWCASSVCGVSSQHLLNDAHPLMRSVYRLHVYYHFRRIFKKLVLPLPFESGFNKYDNPYSKENFLEVCHLRMKNFIEGSISFLRTKESAKIILHQA